MITSMLGRNVVLALVGDASREEIFLAFIEVFNLVVAIVALYFAVRILPAISRDTRRRSWLFLSLAVIFFAVAETVGAVKELANVDLEVLYDSTEAAFAIMLAVGFYYLFNTEFKEMIKLRGQSTTDELTSLYSPTFFEAYLQKRAASVRKEGAELSVLFLGIDNFAAYREKYGRQEADYVLKKVARILQEETKDEDVRGEEVACRYGSDQFTLLLGLDLEAAGRLAERIRYSIKMECSTFSDARMKESLTASIGLASFGLDYGTGENLVKVAEERMLEAARRGRNRVFTGELQMPAAP